MHPETLEEDQDTLGLELDSPWDELEALWEGLLDDPDTEPLGDEDDCPEAEPLWDEDDEPEIEPLEDEDDPDTLLELDSSRQQQ